MTLPTQSLCSKILSLIPGNQQLFNFKINKHEKKENILKRRLLITDITKYNQRKSTADF